MGLLRQVTTGCVAIDDAGMALPRWLRQVRPLVAHAGVTGGLVFDGERWLQLLEGEAPAIDALMAAMAGQPALGAPELLLAAADDPPERLCPGWLIGYVEPDELEPIQGGFSADGKAAVHRLVGVLLGADRG